jgi:hypothetical protein
MTSGGGLGWDDRQDAGQELSRLVDLQYGVCRHGFAVGAKSG